MSLKRTSSAAGLPDRADEAPCCWLCLEEGPDDSGKPLIRDCSCRGTSGFAHLSCMVKYAESKSREVDQKGGNSLNNEVFFAICPNCNQEYQGGVEYALAEAQVEFVEREYKNDLELNLHVLSYKLSSFARTKQIKVNEEQYRKEGEDICSKVLPIIEQMKQNPSFEHDQGKFTIAAAHYTVGQFCEQFSSNEYLEKAKKHYEWGKELHDELGGGVYSVMNERKLRVVEAKMSGNQSKLDPTEEIRYWKNIYNQSKSLWENETSTIYQGVELALALFYAFHTIESERFLTKLVQICRRVHGHDNSVTRNTSKTLEYVKTRLVLHLGTDHPYQPLRYENDGEKIVVQGPVIDDEKRDEEKILTINSKDVIPYPGTPVVVHSLQVDSHLNGKIGDFRGSSEDDRTCEIHFEEEGLDPAFVKLENVRILFNLPEKDETEESK